MRRTHFPLTLAACAILAALSITGCADPGARRIRAKGRLPAGVHVDALNQDYAVWGADTRKKLEDFSYPNSTVGKVGPLGCTGTLVGPRHVLTATHCLAYLSNGDLVVPTFTPSYGGPQQGPVLEAIDVIVLKDFRQNVWDLRKNEWRDIKWKAENFAFDIAVLTLAQDVGYDYGWMPTRAFTKDLKKKDIFWNIGYPSDLGKNEVAYYSDKCRVDEFNSKKYNSTGSHEIKTKCDTNFGHSGGPLFVAGYGTTGVMGVCSGHAKSRFGWLWGVTDNSNYFAGGPSLVRMVAEALVATGDGQFIADPDQTLGSPPVR